MADADLTKLDAPGLQAFIDTGIKPFEEAIKDLRAPGRTPLSLYDVSNATAPLAIGNLLGDSDTAGKNVITNVVKAAGAIDAVLNKHQTAFSDLERNLETVITTMLKTQGDNLTAVDGQKFLTAIGAYNNDMGGSGTTPSSTTPPPTTAA